MMGVKKRVQKKSFLKKEVEDIVPVSKKVLNYFSQNVKELVVIVSIFILAGSALFLLNIYKSGQERNAIRTFTEAFKYYSKAVDRSDPSDYQMASVKLIDLVNKFPRTSVGEKSLFYLGNCYFWLKQYNNSDKYFSLFIAKSSKKDKTFRKYSYEGLGYSAEQSGKFNQAVDFFKKASMESSNPDSDELSLINLARVYEEMNQNDKAVDIYKKIIKNFPQSTNIVLAKGKVFSFKSLTSK